MVSKRNKADELQLKQELTSALDESGLLRKEELQKQQPEELNNDPEAVELRNYPKADINKLDFQGFPLSEHQEKMQTTDQGENLPLTPQEIQERDEYYSRQRRKFYEDQLSKPTYDILIDASFGKGMNEDWRIVPFRYHPLKTSQKHEINVLQAQLGDLQQRAQTIVALAMVAIHTLGKDSPVLIEADQVRRLTSELPNIQEAVTNKEYELTKKQAMYTFRMTEKQYEHSKYTDVRDMLGAAAFKETADPLGMTRRQRTS